MPTHPLPSSPSFERLRKQAKELRNAVRAGDVHARAVVRQFHPRADRALARFLLADAQLVTARSYGFASWARLKRHLFDIEPVIWNPPPAPDPQSHADVFLHLACLTYLDWRPSNVEQARRMLGERAELAAANIYTAAAVGDVQTVRRMIEADPTLGRAKGGPLRWEPLLYACYSRFEEDGGGSLAVARLLLSRGADPNAGFLFDAHYAFTALTGAFGRGEDWHNQPPHPACDALARALLEAGADPNDSQALYNRHFHDDDAHLELLFAYGLGTDKGGPWLTRLTGENASPSTMLVQQLSWAAAHGFRQRVVLLLDHGVDVDGRSPRTNRTAYEEALRAGHASVAEYLLERGAAKVELDPLETFALACIEGRRAEVLERLARDSTLLERLGHHGRVDMLHRAADGRRYDGIRLMVDLGVDINGMVPGTGLDRSVLHNAAGWGGLELVRILVDLGADPNLRDPTFHAKAIGWALHNNQHEVAEYLRSRTAADPDKPGA